MEDGGVLVNRILSFLQTVHDKKGVFASVTLVMAVVLFVLLSFITNENTYTIERFQLSPETIHSTKTVEDPLKTEQDRLAARESVDPVYVFQEEASDNQAAWTSSVFETILVVKQEALSEDSEQPPVQQLRVELEALSNELVERLSDEELSVLLNQPASTLTTADEVVTDEVATALNQPIRGPQLAVAREEAASRVLERLPFPTNFETILTKIMDVAIIETEFWEESFLHSAQASVSSSPLILLKNEGEQVVVDSLV